MPRPAEDRVLSPYTGWTRAHWEAAADSTLAAVRPYASPRHALVDLPGQASASGRHSDGLEGFARTFLTAGFRLSTTHGYGDAGTLAQWYADGIAAGVDPGSPERWPRVNETHQARVEAASIVLALHESRHILWDALDDRVRQQTVEWLAEVIGQSYPPCNWVWFQALVEAFLRSVGGPWSADDIDRAIELTESWYLGDGWYTDGVEGIGPDGANHAVHGDGRMGRNFDWYAGWAMHFYPLWYCRVSGDLADPMLATRYRQRLSRYLAGAQHLYAPDGPPLHQGRSLTYRQAALAPLWAGEIFDASPLPPGRTRRLASGVMRHFADRGAWDARGLHPIGWYGEFPPIRQAYSGPGSPYWSGKGFAGLVLPATHPVWTDVEEPLEVELSDVELTLAVPGWLVSGTHADGVVRVANHGTDHSAEGVPALDDPAYSRHGYATHAGPEYDPAARLSPVDGHVSLVDSIGLASHRRPIVPLGVHGRVGVSRHRAHWPVDGLPDESVWPRPAQSMRAGPWLTTASVLRGAVEVRLARVDAAAGDAVDGNAAAGNAAAGDDPAGGPWILRIGGYPLADEWPLMSTVDGLAARTRKRDGLRSAVVGLRGLPAASASEHAGTNAFGRYSVVPIVDSRDSVVYGEVYAAAVVLGVAEPALPEVVVTVDDRGAAVQVRWPGGETDELRLDPPPEYPLEEHRHAPAPFHPPERTDHARRRRRGLASG